MKKILMYGIHRHFTPVSNGNAREYVNRYLVATFDDIEVAMDYEKKARLKTPKQRSIWEDPIKYLSKSVLKDCCDFEIEVLNEENASLPPHNPILEVKDE